MFSPTIARGSVRFAVSVVGQSVHSSFSTGARARVQSSEPYGRPGWTRVTMILKGSGKLELGLWSGRDCWSGVELVAMRRCRCGGCAKHSLCDQLFGTVAAAGLAQWQNASFSTGSCPNGELGVD